MYLRSLTLLIALILSSAWSATAVSEIAAGDHLAARAETRSAVSTAPSRTVPSDSSIAATDAAVPAGRTSALELPHNLSPWGMFLAADWVVKAVMIGLAFASVATWTIWLVKSIELTRARRAAAKALQALTEARSLPEALLKLANGNSTAATMVGAAHAELELSADATDKSGIKERVASRMERILAGAARHIIRGTGPLATIGATAPFVGLFGTVWGIMNSFIGISRAQTTNLAVVAPGIAEALLATAIGLVAAIPAVIIYNQFSRATASYRGALGDSAAAVERLVSRDLDRDRSVRSQRLKAID